jgi:hypothetical protein
VRSSVPAFACCVPSPIVLLQVSQRELRGRENHCIGPLYSKYPILSGLQAIFGVRAAVESGIVACCNALDAGRGSEICARRVSSHHASNDQNCRHRLPTPGLPYHPPIILPAPNYVLPVFESLRRPCLTANSRVQRSVTSCFRGKKDDSVREMRGRHIRCRVTLCFNEIACVKGYLRW